MLYVGRSDGVVDVWDLMDTSYRPCLVQSVSAPLAVTSLDIAPTDPDAELQLVSVSSEDGVVRVFEAPPNMHRVRKNEVAIVFP